MKKTLTLITVLSLLLTACSQPNPEEGYSCEGMGSQFSCEGLTAEQCGKIPYVKWAQENCGLGSEDNPIGL